MRTSDCDDPKPAQLVALQQERGEGTIAKEGSKEEEGRVAQIARHHQISLWVASLKTASSDTSPPVEPRHLLHAR